MLGRIRDAVGAFFYGERAQVRALGREVREMQAELADLLERLNTWSARESKRQSRSARARLERASEGASSEPLAGLSAPERKAAMRRELFARGGHIRQHLPAERTAP